ncbi:MAG TPA: hypothetical protein VHA52_13025 [Candidatus Babeliaceae bacterium]|nr:hypothetical protein [Candidatus Babeliaceae bacterium]
MEEVIEEINLYQFDGEINFDIQFIESGLYLLTEELDEIISFKLEAIMYLTESFKIFAFLCKIEHDFKGDVELRKLLEKGHDVFFMYVQHMLSDAWRVIGFFILSNNNRTKYKKLCQDFLHGLNTEELSLIFAFACGIDFKYDTKFYSFMISNYPIDPTYENYLFIARILKRDDPSILEDILLNLGIHNINTGRDLRTFTDNLNSLQTLEGYRIDCPIERTSLGIKRNWEQMVLGL